MKNKVQLIGYLGGAPDVRITETGRKMVRFSVATNEVYRDPKKNNEKVKKTQWHQLVAWGKVADIAEKFLAKGKEVAVQGKLVTHTYTDKQGVQRSATEIQVSDVLLLGANS